MRHLKHRHELGVKKAHRSALMANLAIALIKEGRIKTTLAKAKAARSCSAVGPTQRRPVKEASIPKKLCVLKTPSPRGCFFPV